MKKIITTALVVAGFFGFYHYGKNKGFDTATKSMKILSDVYRKGKEDAGESGEENKEEESQ